MRQKPFSDLAPPRPAGEAYRALIDPGLGEEFGPPGIGRNGKGRRGKAGKGQRRGKGRRAKKAHCSQIYSSRTLHGQAVGLSQKVKTKFWGGAYPPPYTSHSGEGKPIHTPHPTHAKFHAFCVSLTHFRLTHAIPPAKVLFRVSRILSSVRYGSRRQSK